MKAAIYSRKSKFTAKGESVENQIQLCKQYGQANLNIVDYIIYEDEGFSGKNTDRPEFQRMLKDARTRKFDTIICYRLDRISRNIGDFSKLIEELAQLSIGFVSIKEQFDTSSPMGRAMMYISSVFAQLERETIAERVRDNMLELSKTGRWLGGVLPLGFTTEKVIEDGKEITYLKPNDEIEVVADIYNKYIELGSIASVQKYYWNEHNKKIIASTIRGVLGSAYYVKSSEAVIDFMKGQGITIVGEANGNGFVSYNKRPNGTTKRSNPSSEWIYAVSKHEGIIEGELWLRVQRQLKDNFKSPRASSSQYSYITGLLRCAKCGHPMTLNYNHTRKDGTRIFYYVCEGKRTYGSTFCNGGNIRQDELDERVINYLEAISTDKTLLEVLADGTKQKNSAKKEIEKIKKAILKNDTALQNLSKRLAVVDDAAADYVLTEITRTSKENTVLKTKLLELENSTEDIQTLNKELLYNNCKNFSKSFKKCITVEDKRMLLQSVVKKITWDSESSHINVELLQ